MSGSKKILLISTEFPPGPGGIGNHAFNLAKYLDKNNVEVKTLTVSDYTDSESEKKFDEKLNFKVVRFARFKNRLKTYKERVNVINDTLKNEVFTHVIFSGRFSILTSLLLKKHRRNLRFIAIGHGAELNSSNPLERYFVNSALEKMDLIIPVSNYSCSKLPAGIDKGKVKVIPNGFDLDMPDKIAAAEKFFDGSDLNLVTVGTLWPRKGHHNVLKSLPEIIADYPGTKYNIVGRLVDLSMSKKYLEDAGLKDHIKVYGSVSNEEMYEVLKKSHIFLLLSETQSSGDFEGFGIAVIEANSFGIPAIGSKKSGLEDAIDNGVSGILVDQKNSKEVKEAVDKIASDYGRFSSGARQWAEKHHWSRIIKRYFDAIDDISRD